MSSIEKFTINLPVISVLLLFMTPTLMLNVQFNYFLIFVKKKLN